MGAQLTAADVLERAANKLEQPGAWTQDEFAKFANGSSCEPEHPEASCFCLIGAIHRVRQETNSPSVYVRSFVQEAIGLADVVAWNDAPGRTQAEVVAKLREAAAIARAEVQQ